jgi:hypothetical protein
MKILAVFTADALKSNEPLLIDHPGVLLVEFSGVTH